MNIEIRDRFNKYMDNDAPKQLKRLFDDLNEGDGIMLQSCFEDFAKFVLEQRQETVANGQFNCYQLCPKCNGEKKIECINQTILFEDCDICNGKGIISTLNGLPP